MATKPEPVTGGCLCGDVRYSITTPPERAAYCHCGMCRKSSGSPYTGWFSIPTSALRWINAEPAPYKSSPGATRSHCRRCGSQISFQYTKRPEVISLTLGTLDAPGAVQAQLHVYWEDRVPGLDLADGLPRK